MINFGLSILCVLILIIISFITFKVSKFTKIKKSKAIIGMLFFLILDATSNIAFYGVNTYIYHEWVKNGQKDEYEDTCYIGPTKCLDTTIVGVIPFLPVITFSSAILLNLNIWISMYFKVQDAIEKMI